LAHPPGQGLGPESLKGDLQRLYSDLDRVDRDLSPELHAEVEEMRRSVESLGGCFVANTLVHTDRGLRAIQHLRPGERVLSQPQGRGRLGWRRIGKTFVFKDQPVWLLRFRRASGEQDFLHGTPNHPFWVSREGWTALQNLRPGNALELSNGATATVLSAHNTGHTATVYNMEVDGFHTYYVGEAGVWVHNADCRKPSDQSAEISNAERRVFDPSTVDGFIDGRLAKFEAEGRKKVFLLGEGQNHVAKIAKELGFVQARQIWAPSMDFTRYVSVDKKLPSDLQRISIDYNKYLIEKLYAAGYEFRTVGPLAASGEVVSPWYQAEVDVLLGLGVKPKWVKNSR